MRHLLKYLYFVEDCFLMQKLLIASIIVIATPASAFAGFRDWFS